MNKSFIERSSWSSPSLAVQSEDAGLRAASSSASPLKHPSAGKLQLLTAVAALSTIVGFAPLQAGDVTYDFKDDPTSILTIGGNQPDYYVSTGGNPGGFLALTWPIGSQKTTVVFPNIDPGKIVTGFTFTCDLRVGNSTGDRAADGFSISFAREGDSILADANSDDFGGNCCAETGTKTGIAVSFDTWAGNTFPGDPNDTSDIEGIIVRVDNVTVKKVALPTRHGACDDITSLQTGPWNQQYWTDGGDPKDPASWAGLCWQPFKMDLTPDGKLTVEWKGNKVLDNFQTTYFPSAGALVFAGRTGGANEHTHVDNIHLVTIPATVSAVPGPAGNFKAAEVGARRVKLTWDAAVVAGDPAAKVAYEVIRDGVTIAPLVTALSYEDRGVVPNTSYSYTIRGKNIAGNAGPDSTTTAKTGVETPSVAFLTAKQWLGINGAGMDAGLGSDHYLSDPPDRIHYVNGFSFGETSNFGDTWGENHLVKIEGVLTAPKSGNFRFFVRSDDNSRLFFNDAGPAIPDENGTQLAMEDGCCNGFQEPDNIRTSDVIPLQAGKSYGLSFYVKEGGGGDWGQVAMREEGDPTPASALTPLRGAILAGVVDASGASIAITTQPADAHVAANQEVSFSVVAAGSSPYGSDYGNAISYQWYNGGVAILNANGPTYTIPFAAASDNGKKFKVVAAVAGASVTSTEATLTVDADTVPPQVVSIVGSGFMNTATVTFSEPVTSPTATDATKYQITGLTVSSATRVGPKTIRLATSKQDSGATYPVTINGVKDNAGLDSAFTGALKAFVLQKGVSVMSYWLNQTGAFGTFSTVKDLPPDRVDQVTDWEGNDGDEYENYFGQTVGLFTPATTGKYIFFMASDDHGELYLSTDASPANKKMIAQEPSWGSRRTYVGTGTTSDNSNTRGEDGSLSNRSDQFPGSEWAGGPAPIQLTGGTSYYMELLYKEGGGGDHGSATFIMEGQPNPANSGSALRGDLISWYVPPSVTEPLVKSITRNPDGTLTIVYEGGALQASPDLINWQDVTGATSPYTFTPSAAMLFGRVRQ